MIIAVLPSIHDVMAAEKALLNAGIWVDLYPKPTSISSDCGMVVLFRKKDKDTVTEIFQDHHLPSPILYEDDNGVFHKLS